MKHGGTAVPGHFDVDLVLFSDSECHTQEITKGFRHFYNRFGLSRVY